MSPLMRIPTPLPVSKQRKNVLLKTHGISPWFDADGNTFPPFVIGIAGGSASGKTYVAEKIINALDGIPSVVVLSQDSFYKALTAEQSKAAFRNEHDFDVPDSVDLAALANCVHDLKQCRSVELPIYSFVEHQRSRETVHLYGPRVILVEGILTFCSKELRDLFDLKVFVSCDSDLMLARRIQRDTIERGRDVEGIINQYLRFVKPSYENFVLPASRYADIIVPGAENVRAIELIVTHVQHQLMERKRRLRSELAFAAPFSSKTTPGNVLQLRRTPQIECMITQLRDSTTSRADYIDCIQRLSSIVLSEANNLLPYKSIVVNTSLDTTAPGKVLLAESICGISILRSGSILETSLRSIHRDIPLGSMLITSDDAGEPSLYALKLPACLKRRAVAQAAWCFLLDSAVGTGAAALMAIRVLIDHGVPENQIIFSTLIVAQSGGVHAIHHNFPGVRILTAIVDPILEEVRTKLPPSAGLSPDPGNTANRISVERKEWHILPGIGGIDDIYFGDAI